MLDCCWPIVYCHIWWMGPDSSGRFCDAPFLNFRQPLAKAAPLRRWSKEGSVSRVLPLPGLVKGWDPKVTDWYCTVCVGCRVLVPPIRFAHPSQRGARTGVGINARRNYVFVAKFRCKVPPHKSTVGITIIRRVLALPTIDSTERTWPNPPKPKVTHPRTTFYLLLTTLPPTITTTATIVPTKIDNNVRIYYQYIQHF